MAKNIKNKKSDKKSRIKLCRRILQIIVALAFILIPWLNSRHISFVYGNFLSFNMAGFPLADPLAVLQITMKNAYLSADLIIGAMVALGIALLLGTVFCSWICPFGFFSDLGQIISKKYIPKMKTDQSVKVRHFNGFKIKIMLFCAGIAGFMIFSTTPILNQFSMPAWYSRIFQFFFTQNHFSLAIVFIFLVLVIEIFLKRRLWCRYVCPQSVVLILIKLLNNKRRLKVEFNSAQCFDPRKGKEPCINACTLGLNPKQFADRLETECTNCGDCVVACKQTGQALKFRF